MKVALQWTTRRYVSGNRILGFNILLDIHISDYLLSLLIKIKFT
jgi:hypothetical protein